MHRTRRSSRHIERRVILATNIAETSLTVPGVTAVIDCGRTRSRATIADRAIDSLETERIAQDAADQRAGRPGGSAPAWHPALEPGAIACARTASRRSIASICPRRARHPRVGRRSAPFEWFEPPSPTGVDARARAARRLGAVSAGRADRPWPPMERLPLNPRVSAIPLAAGGAREAALACAALRAPLSSARPSTSTDHESDLLSAVERSGSSAAHCEDRCCSAVARAFDRVRPVP